ncbi:MAG: hypothetical protein QF569_23500 [Candidatus Poribacteria bacterium]|nr:hypothetical protein [Candidatus Poribacteria bacterium]
MKKTKTLGVLDELKNFITPLSKEDRENLKENILKHGCREPLVLWKERNLIVDGHNRYSICTEIGVPFEVVEYSFDSIDDVKEFMVANQFARRNLHPYEKVELVLKIKPILDRMAKENQSLAGSGKKVKKRVNTLHLLAEKTGLSHDSIHKACYINKNGDDDLKALLRSGKVTISAAYTRLKKVSEGGLAKSLIAPPFSILDTRQGYWQDRKRWWKDKIGDSGETRENTLIKSSLSSIVGGASVFDPVLAEILCTWFGKKGFKVFDCFAGDTVFGYVSGKVGMDFTGIELREEQVALNNERVKKDGLKARYINDDALNMDKHIKNNSMDMFFTCPPYADLEKYSDLKEDISNMDHDGFFEVYKKCLTNTYSKLKENRFAVVVVAEARGPHDSLISLVPKTVDIMVRAGYKFWNEIILVNCVGTLAMRSGGVMKKKRKVGRLHQNVLVFYKGDTSLIKKEFEGALDSFDWEE